MSANCHVSSIRAPLLCKKKLWPKRCSDRKLLQNQSFDSPSLRIALFSTIQPLRHSWPGNLATPYQFTHTVIFTRLAASLLNEPFFRFYWPAIDWSFCAYAVTCCCITKPFKKPVYELYNAFLASDIYDCMCPTSECHNQLDSLLPTAAWS